MYIYIQYVLVVGFELHFGDITPRSCGPWASFDSMAPSLSQMYSVYGIYFYLGWHHI